MDIDSPPTAPVRGTISPLNLPTFSSAFPLPFRVLTLIALAIFLWATNVHLLALLGVDVGTALDLGASEDGEQVHDDRPMPTVVFDMREAGDEAKMSFDGYGRAVADGFPSPRISPAPVVGLFATSSSEEDPPPQRTDRPSVTSLYRSIYALFGTYSVLVSLGWLLFRVLTTPTVEQVLSRGGGDDARGQVEWEMMERWRAVVGVVVGVLAVMGFGTGFGWGRWKVGERERQSLLR